LFCDTFFVTSRFTKAATDATKWLSYVYQCFVQPNCRFSACHSGYFSDWWLLESGTL